MFPVPEVYRTERPTVRTDEERPADPDLYGSYHYSGLKVRASFLWLQESDPRPVEAKEVASWDAYLFV